MCTPFYHSLGYRMSKYQLLYVQSYYQLDLMPAAELHVVVIVATAAAVVMVMAAAAAVMVVAAVVAMVVAVQAAPSWY